MVVGATSSKGIVGTSHEDKRTKNMIRLMVPFVELSSFGINKVAVGCNILCVKNSRIVWIGYLFLEDPSRYTLAMLSFPCHTEHGRNKEAFRMVPCFLIVAHDTCLTAGPFLVAFER